jgi:hypothetical protein
VRVNRLAFSLLVLLISPSLFAELTNSVSIPIKVNRGRVTLNVRINDSKPLNILLDTGCTIPTLRPEIVDQLGLKASGELTINGIAGNEKASTYRSVVLDLGGTTYSPRKIAMIPSERDDRRRRDGVIGSGFFHQFVVELDLQAKTMRLHSPTNFTYQGNGEVLPFRLRSDIPVVKGAVVMSGRPPIEGEFEIDTGCDSGLCLGDGFVKRNDLLASADTQADQKFGVGGSVQTRSGTVPVLKVGKLEIKEPQTDFFVGASPVDEPLAGHIGMGVFRKYKVIFDYSRRQIILE